MEDNQSLIESLNRHIANLQEDEGSYLANKSYRFRRDAEKHPIRTGLKWGTGVGALAGAIKGGITGGKAGAIKGALKGGAVGGTAGAAVGGVGALAKHDVGSASRYSDTNRVKDQFAQAKYQKKLALQRQKNQQKLRDMR